MTWRPWASSERALGEGLASSVGLVVDLSETTFIDSSVIHALLDARRVLSVAVEGLNHLRPAVLEDVKIVASEPASSAIRHSSLGADDTIEVTVAAPPGGVRIDVFDEGEGSTESRPGAHDDGGLGLAIAQRLSRRIGIVHSGQTHAWAEIANGANG
jgi:anti-sigma regulatory factor (Ser/Thr protein kinase)